MLDKQKVVELTSSIRWAMKSLKSIEPEDLTSLEKRIIVEFENCLELINSK